MRRRDPLSSLMRLLQRFPTGQVLLGFIIGLLTGYTLFEREQEPPIIQSAKTLTLQPCFTPQYKCQPLILKALNHAQHSVKVMAYRLTALSIVEALIAAKERGVDVQILFDPGGLSEHSLYPQLRQAGITLLIDRGVAISHNKVILIDEETVILGSYNWTDNAEYRNAENLVLIHSPELAYSYLKNWHFRLKEAKKAKTSSRNILK